MAGRPWEKYLRENNEVAEKLAEICPAMRKILREGDVNEVRRGKIG